MTIALNWKLALCVLVAVVIVTLLTDYIVCGTVTTIVTVPIYMGITQSVLAALILAVATAVILYKHRENFPRIFNGTEIGLRSAIRGDNKLDKK
jgi:glycerol-3-phosphate acyltransferase PlsY